MFSTSLFPRHIKNSNECTHMYMHANTPMLGTHSLVCIHMHVYTDVATRIRRQHDIIVQS